MQTSNRARWLLRAALFGAVALTLACPGDDAAPNDAADDAAEAPPDADDAAEDAEDASPAPDTLRPPDVRPADTAEAPRECGEADDCTLCAFGPPPALAADCECPTCRRLPAAREACAANEAAWEAVCGGRDGAGERCEAPECPAHGRAACEASVCVDACAGVPCPALPCPVSEQLRAPGACCPACPGRCADVAECVACRFARDPDPDAECACPGCPEHPATMTDCALRDAAFDALCGAWALDKGCEPGVCGEAPTIACVDDACAADGAQE